MHCSLNDVRTLAIRRFVDFGYLEEDASYITEHLLACEIQGQQALGLGRVRDIFRVLQSGAAVGAEIRVLRDEPTVYWVSGAGGVGYLPVRSCVTWALDAVRSNPIVAVGARDFFFNGALRVYARQIASAGYLAVFTSSGAPAAVAPAGGTSPVLGTNPFCIGIPTANDPMVLDFSTSTITWSALRSAAETGLSLPKGVALDAFGRSTTVASEALNGSLLPWGGGRGYGLSVAVQCLGILVGAPPVPNGMSDCGFFGVIIDPEAFIGREVLEGLVEILRERINDASLPPSRSRLPGEGWAERECNAIRFGIEISDETYDILAGNV